MPRRKGGLFLPLDVGFTDDDRVVEVGEKPAWLYLCMALASKRLGTDGVLTARQIDRLHVTSWQQRLTALLAVELVVPHGDDTYALRAWFQHNDPVVVVQERRKKDAERKRSGRTDGVRTASEPTRAVEKREVEKSTSAAAGLRLVDAPPAPCSTHPSAGRRPDGECAACRVDRLVDAREAQEAGR